MNRLLAASLLLAPVVAAQSGTIEGVITDRVTGAGIEGASIVAYTRQAVRYMATSDANGRFLVSGAQPGSYELRVEKDGYTLFRRDPAQATVAAGDSAKLNAEMTRQVTLRGRVVDANGDPVAGIPVQVSPGPPAFTTNEAGEFAFEEAIPGSYVIAAVPDATPPTGVDGEERIVPVRTYYNGGQRVMVRGDVDVTGLEIRLESAPVYRVRGTAVDETGTPVAGASVELVEVDRSGPVEELLRRARTSSADDGAFEFDAVQSGDWRVTVTTGGRATLTADGKAGSLEPLRSASEPFSVGRGDVDGVMLRLGVPFTLTGTSDWDGAPPQPVRISLRPADGRLNNFTPAQVQAFSAGARIASPGAPPAPGEIRFDGVSPGKYLVEPVAPPGYYVSAVLLGGTNITDQAVDLVPGSPPLRVFFRTTQGAIRGAVRNSVFASVVVVQQKPSGLALMSFVSSQPDGSFGPINVPPGSYSVAAFDHMDLQQQLDPALLEHVAAHGTSVTVERTGSVSVELPASRWPE